jgi:hypothetical protein
LCDGDRINHSGEWRDNGAPGIEGRLIAGRAGTSGGRAHGREPRFFFVVLPQLRFLGAEIGFHGGHGGAPGHQLGLGHQVVANKVCRAVIRSICCYELRFCLIQGRLGANSLAMGGTEVEVVENRQPLTCNDPIAGGHIERFDPAARHGPDAGKMELVVSDATRRRHGANQRPGFRLLDLQLHVRQLRLGEGNGGRRQRIGGSYRSSARRHGNRSGWQRTTRHKSRGYSDTDRRDTEKQTALHSRWPPRQ